MALEKKYDPSLPTKRGLRLPGVPSNVEGTGKNGPDDIGTEVDDAPRTMQTSLGGPGSAQARLWTQNGARLPELEVRKGRVKAEVVPPRPRL